MTDEMMNKAIPVELFGLEKKPFRSNALFIGNSAQATFSINVLYENTFDPSDNTHRFALLPDNPHYKKIVKWAEETGEDEENYPLEELSSSLHDMWGMWYIVDMSKTPVCRVYTENVCKLVDGKAQIVHHAGDFIHKTDPKTKEDLPDLAIMTQVPVWGFCRKTTDGRWVWMKDNDPMVRIEREINQGRMAYVNLEKDYSIKDGPAVETSEPEKKEEAATTRKPEVVSPDEVVTVE